MMPRKDRTGERTGKDGCLTAIEPAGSDGRQIRWLYLCARCGGTKAMTPAAAKRQCSCGCTRHGYADSPTYRSWQAMKSRCLCEGNIGYERYGSAGVTVCDRWMFFENFLEDMGERPEGKTIDRIGGALIYSKETCRWATDEEQNRNKSNAIFVTIGEITQTVAEWCRETGVSQMTAYSRIRNGWPLDRAVTEPPRGLCKPSTASRLPIWRLSSKEPVA